MFWRCEQGLESEVGRPKTEDILWEYLMVPELHDVVLLLAGYRFIDQAYFFIHLGHKTM